MASSVSIAYALVKTLLNKRQCSVRHLAAELEVNKDTVNNHVLEMENQGLVEIRYGKYGGVTWVVEELSAFKIFFQEKAESILNKLQWSLSSDISLDSLVSTIESSINEVQTIIRLLESA